MFQDGGCGRAPHVLRLIETRGGEVVGGEVVGGEVLGGEDSRHEGGR